MAGNYAHTCMGNNKSITGLSILFNKFCQTSFSIISTRTKLQFVTRQRGKSKADGFTIILHTEMLRIPIVYLFHWLYFPNYCVIVSFYHQSF